MFRCEVVYHLDESTHTLVHILNPPIEATVIYILGYMAMEGYMAIFSGHLYMAILSGDIFSGDIFWGIWLDSGPYGYIYSEVIG